MAPSEPQPPKSTSDDIFAAVYSLLAAVDALEEWAAGETVFEDLPLEDLSTEIEAAPV